MQVMILSEDVAMVEGTKGRSPEEIDNIQTAPGGMVQSHDRCLDEVRKLSCAGGGGQGGKLGKSGHSEPEGSSENPVNPKEGGQSGKSGESGRVLDMSRDDVYSDPSKNKELPPFKSAPVIPGSIPPHTTYDGRQFWGPIPGPTVKDLLGDIFR